MGKMPIEDYREIVATQNGFDSYADMYSQGIRLGNGMDKDPSTEPKKSSVMEQLSKTAEKAALKAPRKTKEQER